MNKKPARRKFIKSLAVMAMSLPILSKTLLQNAFALPRTKQELARIDNDIVETGVVHGNIPSINRPEYLSVGDVSSAYDDDDIMFVLAYPDSPNEFYIVPQAIMVWHEVFNIVSKKGNPYCLTYSPISGTLAFYNSRVDRKNLIFDSFGTIYNNNTILIDRNTGSLWVQLLGMAYEGPLIGRGMNYLPVYWTKWKNAKTVFPNAQVLAKPLEYSRDYGRDPYGSFAAVDSYYQNDQIIYPLTHYDTRLHAKKQVYGLELNGLIVAVDIDYVKKEKVVNFTLGYYPLLAMYDEDLDTVRIYNRQFWTDKDPGLFIYKNNEIRDFHTNSLWDIHGTCLSGNLIGARMEQIFGFYSFWFSFASMHPETFLVPSDIVVPNSALEHGI